MPKQRTHPHHHSVRERRLRQRGLQLPDPVIPSHHPGLPYIPRTIPPGWRFRSASGVSGYSVILLIFAVVTLLTLACAAGTVLLGAIMR